MKIIVFFVEITEYNIARIHNVYEQLENAEFSYVYCSASVSGHTTNRELPENSIVLDGDIKSKKATIKKLFKEKDYDFAIINGYSDKLCSCTISICRRKSIPYAIETDTQLNIPKNKIKAFFKSVYLHKIFSGSSYGFAGGTRQKQLFYYYGMPEENVYVMPMSIDVERYKNIVRELSDKQTLKKVNGFSGKKIILYVGRFAEEKNLEFLLNVIAELKKSHKDFYLLLVGKGEKKETLQKQAVDLEISEIVIFYDYMSANELAAFYKLSDVFVLPSKFEPWGLVVNEALACGLPVVASDKVGSVDDLIIPGENGDVFANGNLEKAKILLEKWLYQKNGISGVDITEKWNHDYYLNSLNAFLIKVM